MNHYYNNIMIKFNEQKFQSFKQGLKANRLLNPTHLSDNEIEQILFDFSETKLKYYKYNHVSETWSSYLPTDDTCVQWEWQEVGGHWAVGQEVKDLIYNHFKIRIVGCGLDDDLHCELARLVRCLQSDEFIDIIVGLLIENFYTQNDSSKPGNNDFAVRSIDSIGMETPTIPSN